MEVKIIFFVLLCHSSLLQQKLGTIVIKTLLEMRARCTDYVWRFVAYRSYLKVYSSPPVHTAGICLTCSFYHRPGTLMLFVLEFGLNLY